MSREELRFPIIAEDKASDAFKRVGDAAFKMSRDMDGAAYRAAGLDQVLKSQRETLKRVTDATLVLAKTDDILAEAEKRTAAGALAAEFALKRENEALKENARASRKAADENDNLAAKIRKAADSAKGGAPAWLTWLGLGAATGLPTTLAGVGAGAAIGLGGAAVAGGGALAAFGAIAKPVLASALKAEQQVNAAQNTYQASIANGISQAKAYKAEQLAISKAYADLSPQQIALSQQLGNMAQAWQNLKAAQTPLVAGALQPWLKSVTDLTGKLGPVIKAVSPVIWELGTDVDRLVNSAAFRGFRDFVASTGSWALAAVGGTIIDFVKSFLILLPKFNPLIEKTVGWLGGLGPAVLTWASSKKASDDITRFMGWFTKNGPAVGGLLRNIGGALKALAPGLGPAATTEINVISGFFGLIAKLPPSIAKPLVEIAGAMLLLNKLGVVSVGVKLLTGGAGAAGAAGAGAAAGEAAAGGAAAGLWGRLLPGVRFIGGALVATVVVAMVLKNTSTGPGKNAWDNPFGADPTSTDPAKQGVSTWAGLGHLLAAPFVSAWHGIEDAAKGGAQSTVQNVGEVTGAMKGAGATALTSAAQIDKSFVTGLKAIGFSSPLIARAVYNFTSSVQSTGDTSTRTKRARDQLIADLISTGIQGDKARQLVAGLQRQINGLHGKNVSVGVFATGSGGVQVTDAMHKALVFKLSHLAAGGIVPGSGHGDTVPAMLTPGEVIVPKGMVAAGAVDHLRGRLPGFAAGGLVGMAPWAASTLSGDIMPVAQSITQAALNKLAAASFAAQLNYLPLGPGGPLSGSAATAQAFARSIMFAYGWGQGQFPYLQALWNRECVPLRTRILTRRGWVNHDEVRVGDETIGYNLETRHSEWTRVTAVHHYGPSPTVRFGNQYWSAEATPNHRWLMEEMGTESRYTPRPEHRLVSKREVIRGEALVELRERHCRHRIVLARKAQTPGTLNITTREAALLGWIAGDGWVTELQPAPEECPECGWLPFVASGYSDGRIHKAPQDKALSVRSHRVKKHGVRGRSFTTRSGRGTRLAICQAKVENFAAIEDALDGVPVACRTEYERRPGWKSVRSWYLTPAYSRDLLARTGNPKTDAVAQVLAMSSEQRDAWLSAIIAAEGTREGSRIVIYQNDGPVADAIELAVYLSGQRPSRVKDGRNGKIAWAIGCTAPYVGGQQRRSFQEPGPVQEVWCVTTELGTWTAQQDGQVFLTGNSGWNAYAVNPSSGAAGIPQNINGWAAYRPGDYMSQIRWGDAYISSRYGSPQSAWAHEVSMGWYDKGGYLPPGLTLAWNGTGRPEPVGAAAGRGGDVHIYVSVPPTVNPRDAGRQVADLLAAHVKGGGRIYPPGIAPR